MRLWLIVPCLMAVVSGPAEAHAKSAPAVPEPGSASISIALGRNDFRTYCAACHGVSARGDGTIAEFLTIVAPDLTHLRKLNAGIFPRERMTEVIDGRAEVKVHGARDMPVWGDWFEKEAAGPDTTRQAREIIVRERINALVNYLESIQEN